MAQIIYTMKGLSKSYDQKVILKDIYLSFFDGAKIGILGLNGSGKSTILRIMAGWIKTIMAKPLYVKALKLGIFHKNHNSMKLKL